MSRYANRCQRCGLVFDVDVNRKYCTPCQPRQAAPRRVVDEYEQLAGSLVGRGLAHSTIRSTSTRKR